MKPGSNDPQIEGYEVIRQDRTTNGEGLAILVDKELKYSVVKTIQHDQAAIQAIDVHLNNSTLRVVNFYLPPGADASFENVLKATSNGPTIVVGDANCHSSLWHSNIEADATGKEIEDLIAESNLVVINGQTATSIPYDENQRCSSPDITLVSENICLESEWTTLKKRMSDHLPILVSLKTG